MSDNSYLIQAREDFARALMQPTSKEREQLLMSAQSAALIAIAEMLLAQLQTVEVKDVTDVWQRQRGTTLGATPATATPSPTESEPTVPERLPYGLKRDPHGPVK